MRSVQMDAGLGRILFGCGLALVFALALLWGLRPLAHDDLFWHLRTGEKIASELRVPRQEPFSHTMKGAPWTTHEWGFEVLVYGAWRAGGLPGLVALQAVLALGILASTWRRCRGSPARGHPLALLILLLGVQAAAPNVVLRAALVGTLLLAATLELLERFRESGRKGVLLAVLAVFLLWANVHASAVLGVAVLGCFAVPHLVRRSGGRFLLLALPLAAALVTLVNPNGILLWRYPLELDAILYRSGERFDLGIFAPPTPASHPWFFALLSACLLLLFPLRRATGIPAGEALSALFFLLLALRSNRFIFDFVVLAVPASVRLLGSRPWPARLQTQRGWLAAQGAVLAAALGSLALAWSARVGGLVDPRFPEAAVRLIRSEALAGRLYNPPNLGGYLMWMLREPVFWHGESVLFFPLQRELFSLPFSEAMGRFGVEVAILDAADHVRWRSSISSREWALVYWDDFTALYLRRAPERERFLSAHEYRYFGPFGYAVDLALLARSEAASREAFAELARAARQNPGVQAAHYHHLAGLLHLERRELPEARRAFEAALRLQPDQPEARSALEGLEARARGPGPGGGAATQGSERSR